MAEFEVKIVKVDSVEKHPDADRLSIVKIGGFNCISAKLEDGSNRYKENDLVVYIPEGAVLPEWMLKKMGFWNEEKNKGGLAGNKGDRVKCCKLRGIISQGILYPVIPGVHNDETHGLTSYKDNRFEMTGVTEGQDVAELLGITKYIPEVPVHMSGRVKGSHSEYALKYDLESIQTTMKSKFMWIKKEDWDGTGETQSDRPSPSGVEDGVWVKRESSPFDIGEEVQVTSKRHGTLCALVVSPNLNDPEFLDGKYFASSKGQLAKGLLLNNSPENKDNVYNKVLLSMLDDGTPMSEVLSTISKFYDNKTVYVFGEIFGPGIQDLKYGLTNPRFEVFDIWVGMPPDGRFLNDGELEYLLKNVTPQLKRVYVLYRGPFSLEKMTELRDGNDYIDGKMIDQIREGIVIKPVIERKTRMGERLALKFVSPNYLLRKGEVTEYN